MDNLACSLYPCKFYEILENSIYVYTYSNLLVLSNRFESVRCFKFQISLHKRNCQPEVKSENSYSYQFLAKPTNPGTLICVPRMDATL